MTWTCCNYFITPRYSLIIAKVGVKQQPINKGMNYKESVHAYKMEITITLFTIMHFSCLVIINFI